MSISQEQYPEIIAELESLHKKTLDRAYLVIHGVINNIMLNDKDIIGYLCGNDNYMFQCKIGSNYDPDINASSPARHQDNELWLYDLDRYYPVECEFMDKIMSDYKGCI